MQVLLKMLVKIIKCLYNLSNINIGSNNFNNSVCTYNIENIKSCTRSNYNFAYCPFRHHFYLLLVPASFQNMKECANNSNYTFGGFSVLNVCQLSHINALKSLLIFWSSGSISHISLFQQVLDIKLN